MLLARYHNSVRKVSVVGSVSGLPSTISIITTFSSGYASVLAIGEWCDWSDYS
jgi:hypothetical protein